MILLSLVVTMSIVWKNTTTLAHEEVRMNRDIYGQTYLEHEDEWAGSTIPSCLTDPKQNPVHRETILAHNQYKQ